MYFIEERHEHTQKILKRIFYFCLNFKQNTCLNALKYFDKKILLGIKYSLYNFYQVMKDSSSWHTIYDKMSRLIRDTSWLYEMHPTTKDTFYDFYAVDGVSAPSMNLYESDESDNFLETIHNQQHSEEQQEDISLHGFFVFFFFFFIFFFFFLFFLFFFVFGCFFMSLFVFFCFWFFF